MHADSTTYGTHHGEAGGGSGSGGGGNSGDGGEGTTFLLHSGFASPLALPVGS